MSWIDISQPLTNNIAHWPEDQPFIYETTVTKDNSGSVNIGRMTTSTHIGTHVDAPFHYDTAGRRILDLDINRYIGDCTVIDLSGYDAISAAALQSQLTERVERVLIKTSLPNNPEHFPENVPGVTQDGSEYLNSLGVKLIGVDTPSVDDISSKALEGHHALYEHDIYILENVMLDNVTPGNYELIALPLALKDADGSPVRAVIRPKGAVS